MQLPINLDCGDLIAFSGVGFISEVIKRATDRPRNLVSHVGVMVTPTLLAEATTLNGENGVVLVNLEYKFESYPGEIYGCRLKKEIGKHLGQSKFIERLMAVDGQPYSKLQAVLSLFRAGKDLHNWGSSWYCSKLAADAYQAGGLVPPSINTAVTPSELTKWPIFDELVLLKGKS